MNRTNLLVIYLKPIACFFLMICILQCKTNDQLQAKNADKILNNDFQNILDSALLHGTILLYDSNKNTYYSNNFDFAQKARLPASTFKIANTIIGLETGVIPNDSFIFKWNGENRNLAIWEQDLILDDAFHYSCVPCYQYVARNIGVKRMNQFLKKLHYGDMQVDSSNIDRFWLVGDSKISAFQQIDFLRRLYNEELPISSQTQNSIMEILFIEKNKNATLSGKTGWAVRVDNNHGWFVGFAETHVNTLFIATLIEPTRDFDMQSFPAIRKQIATTAIESYLENDLKDLK